VPVPVFDVLEFIFIPLLAERRDKNLRNGFLFVLGVPVLFLLRAATFPPVVLFLTPLDIHVLIKAWRQVKVSLFDLLAFLTFGDINAQKVKKP
jgi:hypothetical protein